ncbi:ATP-binding protein [Hahella ganghwensis]|uniref:ATP-binding protein n=1 Tax=Hahella ganghwensis TaxID=286420 RepID=UPI00036975A7|nr:sensor histidine kinase [Hahella ganghwensis]
MSTNNSVSHLAVKSAASRFLKAFSGWFSSLSLQKRMMVFLVVLVLFQSVLLSGFTLQFVATNLEEQMGRRALQMAHTVSQIPQVVEGLESQDLSLVQPLVEEIRRKTDAAFIVVGDTEGIRYSHPLEDRLGKRMVGGDNAPALVEGQSYVSRAVGSMGPSMRGKAPVFDEQGNIIGLVSVGYMLDQVEQTVGRYQSTVEVVTLLTIGLGILVAIGITRYVKSAILGLEPEEIARLLQERDATLESVREGIIAINSDGEIMTINKAAIETMDLPRSQICKGKPIKEVLIHGEITNVLQTGEPQYDQEIVRNNRVFIVNRIPIMIGDKIAGVVSSFRAKDEIDQLTHKIEHLEEYADLLRCQAHEYSNKLSTIAGLIQIGAPDRAIELINQETSTHQNLIQFLVEAVPDPVLSGCLLGKFNRARELGLQLEIDRESHMADVPEYLSRDELVSVIGNLLDNAFEATLRRPDSPREVRLSMTDLGKDLIFEIEDNGSGISPEIRDKIFVKGVSQKNIEGHGIGLYLVKTILENLNGDIVVEDGEIGARVTVYIPKQKAGQAILA